MICSFKSCTKFDLFSHYKNQHTINTNSKRKKNFPCPRCDVVCKNSKAFGRHEKAKANPLKICPNCSFKSCSKSALENHFKNDHPGHKRPPIWKTIEQTTKNVHEGSKEIEVTLILSSGNNTNEKFTCSGCNSVFKSEKVKDPNDKQ